MKEFAIIVSIHLKPARKQCGGLIPALGVSKEGRFRVSSPEGGTKLKRKGCRWPEPGEVATSQAEERH
jgi:hypothetical protein